MKLDQKKTALLTLDFQNGTLEFVPGAEAIIPNATRAVEFARKQQYLLIHVGIGFAGGHPEISDVESVFKMLKQKIGRGRALSLFSKYCETRARRIPIKNEKMEHFV